jgi:predicted molibdopterin-dependent oxidoreductase YjgC
MGDRKIEMTINGQKMEAKVGETVLNVAERAGIEIPTLCSDPRLSPSGSCRMCLVEVEGQGRLQPSCAWKVSAGMKVQTETERIRVHRDSLLSFYMADHNPAKIDALSPPNELLGLAAKHGCSLDLEPVAAERSGRDDPNPYIHFDPDLCILCERCVRYCDEVEGVNAITLSNRGSKTTISTANDIGLLESTCEFCGGCIGTCPTGALREKASIGIAVSPEKPVRAVRTTCNYCGVGCQMDLHVVDDKVVKITAPPPGETVNDGNLCIKGRFAYEFIHHEERLKTPLIRGEDGELHPASWNEAIRRAANGLMKTKKEHGADSLAFISSSRCTGEENYLMQKLSRAAFGTNNCHQCAAT